jgi:hypothetical protein
MTKAKVKRRRRKHMKLKLTDGERLVASWMIASLNAPGQSLDIAGARVVAALQDGLDLAKLDISKNEEADRSNTYELESLQVHWLRDELDQNAQQKNIPARYAKYAVLLHDRLRNALDSAEPEDPSE